jgi:hypothetical protein
MEMALAHIQATLTQIEAALARFLAEPTAADCEETTPK